MVSKDVDKKSLLGFSKPLMSNWLASKPRACLWIIWKVNANSWILLIISYLQPQITPISQTPFSIFLFCFIHVSLLLFLFFFLCLTPFNEIDLKPNLIFFPFNVPSSSQTFYGSYVKKTIPWGGKKRKKKTTLWGFSHYLK